MDALSVFSIRSLELRIRDELGTNQGIRDQARRIAQIALGTKAMKPTVWDLDHHTKAKHIILRKYLDAWLPKITKYNGRVIYYDGFAGPGIYSSGELGSPIIALNALLEHTHKRNINCEIKYFFVEERKDRFDSLQAKIQEMLPQLPKTVTVIPVHEESDHVLCEILDSLDNEGKAMAPTFAFVDPFGVKGIPLNTIKRLMAHPRCEVMINLMLGSVQRFVSTPEFEKHCDELFGCPDWRAARDAEGNEREVLLRNLYQDQLQDSSSGVGADYVRRFTMRDKKNRTIYDLFFATNHSAGIDAMKDAMWKVDTSGEYSFSDATNPHQQTLFSKEPDWSSLIAALHKQYAGQVVPWPDVEEAIRLSPFRILKRPIVSEITNGSLASIENPDGVRRNTLSEYTLIRFAPA